MAGVVLVFLVLVVLAVVVIAIIALPHLREGSPLLTSHGEHLARRAGSRVSELAEAALGTASALHARADDDESSGDRLRPGGRPAAQRAAAARAGAERARTERRVVAANRPDSSVSAALTPRPTRSSGSTGADQPTRDAAGGRQAGNPASQRTPTGKRAGKARRGRRR